MANRVNLGNIIGATGATGPQGPAGQNGVDGLTPYIQNGTWWIGSQDTHKKALGDKWYYGTDIPTIQGNNGDLYLRTNTADVYYKEDGIWSIIVNIKGAKGDKGDKGDTALSVTVGTVTTASSDTPASVTNSGTSTDLVLDFVIPKGETGEQGEKGDTGASSVFVGGFLADTISFDSDPQGQIDNKLSGNFGSENAGKYLQVDNNGNVQPVSSDAENDVIDGYYYNGAFYEDSEHTQELVGQSGKLYIDLTENIEYRFNENENIYVALSGGGSSTLISDSDPTSSTVGEIGQLYLNTTTGKLFICNGKSGDDYIWSVVNVSKNGSSVTFEIAFDTQNKAEIIVESNGITKIKHYKNGNAYQLQIPEWTGVIACINQILPTYSSLSSYNVGDLVSYDNYFYKCNTEITTPEPFDANKWTQTTLVAEMATKDYVDNIVGDIDTILQTLNNGGGV